MKPLIPYFPAPVLEIPLGDMVIPLHGFGLLVAIGFVVGGQVAMRRAKRVGLDSDLVNRLIGWLVLGTFVGGHVGYGLMYAREEYLREPIKFLYFFQGLSSFGGFAVCVPLAVWFFWKEKARVWPYMDCIAFGMAIGWFFGRMGCFVAHDHPGTPTNFWLGVYGICPNQGASVACHDMGLYEALWSLSMFLLFVALDRKPRVPGFYPVLLGLAYGPTRFVMDFFRPAVTDNRWAFDLTPGQYWSVVLTIVCALFLAQRLRSGAEPVWRAEAPPEEPKESGDASEA